MKALKLALLTSALLLSAGSNAAVSKHTELIVFGNSLSDTGNNAAVLDSLLGGLRTPTPIPNLLTQGSLIPTFPYASGRYSNGNVWVDHFAPTIGQSATALLNGGTNYAFGGARMGPVNPRGLLDPGGFPPTVATQVASYLGRGPANPGALYVLTGGGNDARDAFGPSGIAGLIAGNANTISPAIMPSISALIANAATGFSNQVSANVAGLKAAGAVDIIVWNIPNVGTTPESLGRAMSFTSSGGAPTYAEIGSALASAMNSALVNAVGSIPGVHVFDFHGILQTAVSDSTFVNVSDACAASSTCNPANYLYWDGIHPTSAMHAILSSGMVDLVVTEVPEPHTYATMLAGIALIAGLVAVRRRA